MTADELKAEIRAQLRQDPKAASKLVGQLGRLARDPATRAEARFFRGEVEFVLGRLRPALRAYDDARRAFGRLRLDKPRLAAELGAVQVLALLGDGARTRTLVRAMRRRRGDAMQSALIENAIGSALDALGDEAGAEQAFSAAISVLGRKRDHRARMTRATARHNLAIRLARRGKVTAATTGFERCLKEFEDLGVSGWAAWVRHNRAWSLGLAGRVEEALDELRAVRAAFGRDGDRRGAALALVDEADLEFRLGAFESAAGNAARAAPSLPPQEAGRAQLLVARSRAAAGQRGKARGAARRAAGLFRKAGDAAGLAEADVVLERDLARAETTLRKHGHWFAAIGAILAQDLPASRLNARVSRYPAALRRWFRPEVLRRQGRLREAFRAVEALRRIAPSPRLREAALSAHFRIYEEFAKALLERGRPRDRREAFLVIDALRARTLREEGTRAADPRTEQLRRQLDELWSALERNEGGDDDLRRTQLPLFDEVTRCEREFADAVSGGSGGRSTRDAGAELPRAPCLAYGVLDGQVVSLLARDGEVAIRNCGNLERIRGHLDAFLFQVNRRLHGARDTQVAETCLDRMRDFMLGDTALPAHVHAVLPPELGAVPLEALAPDVRFTHLPYACARGRRWKAGGSALVVGVESDRLPDVAAEVDAVRRRLTRPRVLRGNEAKRAAILQATRGRGLVHLAGHARAREDLALLSAMRVKDGWITASDLADRRLDDTLLVLSACRTGDPSLRWNSEAFGGFPRAALAAGASGLVASRWDVPDEIAKQWMIGFYTQLRALPPGEALAAAACGVRRKDPHPAAWAAFLYVQRGITNR